MKKSVKVTIVFDLNEKSFDESTISDENLESMVVDGIKESIERRLVDRWDHKCYHSASIKSCVK